MILNSWVAGLNLLTTTTGGHGLVLVAAVLVQGLGLVVTVPILLLGRGLVPAGGPGPGQDLAERVPADLTQGLAPTRALALDQRTQRDPTQGRDPSL